jgi:predicted nucleic acid-binding protein
VYLLDTNTLSARLRFPALATKSRKASHDVLKRVHDRVYALPEVNISILTFWEIERGLMLKGAVNNLRVFRFFAAHVNILPLDDRVFNLAAEVWVAGARLGHRPPEVDALIVATARAWDYTLVSDDVDVIRCAAAQVPPIPLENWYERE